MSRLDPEERKEQILAAAMALSETHGYQNITRDQIAAAADVTFSLVSHYYKDMRRLRRSIMFAAIKGERLAVLAQGLALHDRYALFAPPELQARAVATLVGRGADV